MVCLFDSSVGEKKVGCEWPGESSFPVTCYGLKYSRVWGTRMLKWLCHLKCTPAPKGKCLEDLLFTNISRAQFVTKVPECLISQWWSWLKWVYLDPSIAKAIRQL